MSAQPRRWNLWSGVLLFLLLTVLGSTGLVGSVLAFLHWLSWKSTPSDEVTKDRLCDIALASRDIAKRTGHWPMSIEEVATTRPVGTHINVWRGLDAWGNHMIYVPCIPAERPGFVASLGRDGTAGGTGGNTDLVCLFDEGTNNGILVQKLPRGLSR